MSNASPSHFVNGENDNIDAAAAAAVCASSASGSGDGDADGSTATGTNEWRLSSYDRHKEDRDIGISRSREKESRKRSTYAGSSGSGNTASCSGSGNTVRSGSSVAVTFVGGVASVDVPKFLDDDDSDDDDDDDDDDEEEEEEVEEEEEEEEEDHHHIDERSTALPLNYRESRTGVVAHVGSSSGSRGTNLTNQYRELRSTTISSNNSVETTPPGAVPTRLVTAASYDNMVAAMNEHLTTSSATSNVRTTTNTTTSSSITGNSCVATARDQFQVAPDDGKAGILGFPCDFDHMYASMTDGGAPAAATATSALGVSPLRGNEARQNDLTEVKHLKELLLLHLDLIQQQSEQIVTKDKLLAALRQENETLKLRLERMDRRVNLQKLRSESSDNSILPDHIGACSPPNTNSVNVPSTSELHRNIQSESSSPQYNESFKIRLNTSGGITTVKQEINENTNKHEVKSEPHNESRHEWEAKKKRRSDPTPLTTSGKRMRGVSCSSNVSNDASSILHEKGLTLDIARKGEKKGKSLMKKESFLTTEEHYYTAVGDSTYSLALKEPEPADTSTNLEVPNWRVKIYTSCYTMEGTENLDDEIFNKRHLKLENDERRRKRWDVQRIREQRHIEKLKQRQERQNHQATCYNTNHTGPCPSTAEEEIVKSLWPDVEQIQSLQVDSQLPVTAFGAPIPSFIPSEFSLPWLSTVRSKNRRPKRSTGRRKSSRR